jgi:predicted nuclease with TOPRIM domain
MDPITSSSVAQIAGALVVALAAIAIGLQKIFKGWKETNAESRVITIMHEELDRMSTQNTFLAGELNKLQQEIVILNRELHKLNLENQRLHTEVVALTAEVTRLQGMLLKGGPNDSTNQT